MSSLSVRFFNSFKSKYLNFFFYLFDCQVSCAFRPCVPSSGFVSLSRPIVRCSSIMMTSPDFGRPGSGLVGLDGLEPSTSRLSGARSSHLSYRPVFLSGFSVRPSLKAFTLMVEMKGFEPLTPCLQGRCSPN